MADDVKQIFKHKFTTSELLAKTPVSFTTNSTTAHVIKSVESTQNENAAIGVEADLTVGLTSDFNASPSLFSKVAQVAKSGIYGAEGSVIVDRSSTVSIRPTSAPPVYQDLQLQMCGFSGSKERATQFKITPEVNGATETALAVDSKIQSSVASVTRVDNFPNDVMVAIKNETANIEMFYSHQRSSTNGKGTLYVRGADNGVDYGLKDTLAYSNWGFTGRFWFGRMAHPTTSNGNNMAVIDTQCAANILNTSNYPHNNITLGTVATANGISSYGQLFTVSHLNDGKNPWILESNTRNGIMTMMEIPDDPLTATKMKTTAVLTSNSEASSLGPNSNRMNIHAGLHDGSITSGKEFWTLGYHSATGYYVFIARSKDGSNWPALHFYPFKLANFGDTTTSNTYTASNATPYAWNRTELKDTFGWLTDTSTWAGSTSATGGSGKLSLGNTAANNVVPSATNYDLSSLNFLIKADLDNDLIYFRNNTTAGGKVATFNMKTNEFADYFPAAFPTNSGGTDTSTSGLGSSFNWFKSTPSNATIGARTYNFAPSLGIRVSGVTVTD